MSIEVMTLVWKYAPVADTELTLMLAMADFAHADGSSIFPSQVTLAQRIRKSQRQTRRLLRDLANMGLIEKTGEMPDHRYIYRIKVEALLPPDIAMSARTHMTGEPGHSYDTPTPDIAMSAKPLVRNHQVTVPPPPSVVTPPKGESQPTTNGKRLPKDWTVPDNARVWARERGWTDEGIAAETESFSDYWHSKTERRVDWEATWRNWIRKAEDRPRSPNGRERRVDPKAEQRLAEIIATVDALEGRER
jgi:Helix-turn-helix domain